MGPLMTTDNYAQKVVYNPPPAKREVRSWQFNEPPADIIDTELQLLTVGGISIKGRWEGVCGQHFSAWSLDVAHLVN